MQRREVIQAVVTVLLGFAWLCLAAPAGAACAKRSGNFAVDGVSLYWEEHGEPADPPLLMLHGFGESMSVWERYVPALCGKYNVVLLDLRGHGRSTNPRDSFSFRAASDDVLALMDHLHHERFRALGVSTGGIALLHVATRAPSRLEALVLVGAAPYFTEQARKRVQSIVADKEGTLKYLAHFATRGDEQATSLLRQFSAFASAVDDPAFTPPQLAAIQARTLIVYGDRDEFFPVEQALQLYRAIPHAYLRIYPNGDHEPIYRRAAVAEFSAQLLDFFDKGWNPQ
jgi:pimeloyl-ACP methyl ester carboxylesterase